jgi:hypothetical protein
VAWRLFPGAPELLANASYLGYYKDTSSAIIIPAPVPTSWAASQTMRNLVQGGASLEYAAERLANPAAPAAACTALEEVSRRNTSSPSKDPNATAESHFVDSEWVWAPERRWLASFFGTVHPDRSYSKGIRQDLQGLLGEGKGEAEGGLFHVGHVSSERYEQAVAHSRFCLCPPGWTPWSQRLFYAIAVGCIPVR